MKKLRHVLIVCFMILVSYHAATAQTLDGVEEFDFNTLNETVLDINSGLPSGVSEELILDITPANPRPNEDVVIKLRSNATNLDRAQITWRLNSQIVPDQIGATQLSFTLGQLNESQSLTVTVKKYEGGEISRTHFFTPTEVDLLYEPLTYTPPFYLGRAQATHQSTVRVVALPRILDDFNALIPTENYVYTWKENGKVIQDQSGYGKNIFTYTNGLLEDVVQISVTAVPRNYNAYAQGSISIKPRNPVVVVYENNPVYGTIFEQAITGTFSLNRNEITLKAIPYFFSNKNLTSTWNMNGKVIEELQRPDEVVFRIESESQGISNISTQISNSEKILQTAGAVFQLLFQKL